ncbi:MAG: hypothetical protein RLZZ344_1118 [Pseudomonadota bacterium]|jgi:hypothetical protein
MPLCVPRLLFPCLLPVFTVAVSGCDQVRQRLTEPSSIGAPQTSPASPSPVAAPPPAPSATPATSETTARSATAVPSDHERYSSRDGGSGSGPVERRQSSSARPQGL